MFKTNYLEKIRQILTLNENLDKKRLKYAPTEGTYLNVVSLFHEFVGPTV